MTQRWKQQQTMKLLIVTNLYPPQELGGYGRSMADFAWGLQQRGHEIQVLSTDAPTWAHRLTEGPSGEQVSRNPVKRELRRGHQSTDR